MILASRVSHVLAGLILLAAASWCVAAKAESGTPIPPSLTTPDSVETRLGTLKFKDGAPSAETAQR